MRPRPTIGYYKATAKMVSVQYCSKVHSILLTTRDCSVALAPIESQLGSYPGKIVRLGKDAGGQTNPPPNP